jgi:hypothetical protein
LTSGGGSCAAQFRLAELMSDVISISRRNAQGVPKVWLAPMEFVGANNYRIP